MIKTRFDIYRIATTFLRGVRKTNPENVPGTRNIVSHSVQLDSSESDRTRTRQKRTWPSQGHRITPLPKI